MDDIYTRVPRYPYELIFDFSTSKGFELNSGGPPSLTTQYNFLESDADEKVYLPS